MAEVAYHLLSPNTNGGITSDEIVAIPRQLNEDVKVAQALSGGVELTWENGRRLVLDVGEAGTTSVKTLYQQGEVEPGSSSSYAGMAQRLTSETQRSADNSTNVSIGVDSKNYKGRVTFGDATGRALIEFSRAADLSTAVHELAHVARRMAYEFGMWTEPQGVAVEKWAGVEGGRWNRAADEKFGGVENSMSQAGSAKTAMVPRAVKEASQVIAEAMKRTSGAVKGSPFTDSPAKDVPEPLDAITGERSRQFLFVNTHFDHESEEARLLGAEMVGELVQLKRLPTIVTGDFNCEPGSEPLEVLASFGLSRVELKEGPRGTFTGFEYGLLDGDEIDHVFLRGLEPCEMEIVRRDFGGRYPSDHFPLSVDVSLD